MPALPDGDPAPADGLLPSSAADGAAGRGLGIYLHVPFCAVRCGYCDFNTYTLPELGDSSAPDSYLTAAHAEIDLAARVLAGSGVPERPVSTVFVGGGTPTLLPAAELIALLEHVRSVFGLAPRAEVTTEANPDSVTADSLAALAQGGFTRVSFGMQSAVPAVLATLDRTHDPLRVPAAVREARAAGLAVSLDLIYGTPGESLADWDRSLAAAIEQRPDHVSAYALTVEPGTALARRVRRSEVGSPQPDDQADKYELADERLASAGYRWYEVSNFALGPDPAAATSRQCRHNLAYWRSDDWWGIGPGAHSHVGGVRWWNVKHPKAFADRLAAGASPAAGRESLDDATRAMEDLMLRVRLSEGWTPKVATPHQAATLERLERDGLLLGRDPVVLSRRGRLLADHVVRELMG